MELVLVLLVMLDTEIVLAVPNFTVDREPVDFLTTVPGLGGSMVNAVGGGNFTLFWAFCSELWLMDFLLLVELAGLSRDKLEAAWDNLVTGEGAIKSEGLPIL